MHLDEIIWFLSLPALIYLSYRIILWAVKRYEKKKSEQ
jgi:hypothetical protein